MNTSTLPVQTIADVLAIAPGFLRPDDPAPVRDGIFAALFALCSTVQEWAIYAAAQADVLRATGVYEDAIGDERSIFRSALDNEAYRTVILTPPAVVSPEAIIAAANAILAPFTSVQAQYAEPMGDAAFFFDDGQGVTNTGTLLAPVWVYNGAPLAYFYDDGDIPRSPDYPDRRYASEAAQNGGIAYPNREPGAARFFDDNVGRIFFLRVPDLSAIDAQDTPMYEEPLPLTPAADDFYVGTAAVGSWTSYILQEATDSPTLYASIISAIARIKGQSMRWILWVDPNLGT